MDTESNMIPMDRPESINVPQEAPQVHPLTAKQERKLVDYLEERFLDVTRNYKKRSQPTSSLQTLASYLMTTHALLSVILQIAPLDPSASLRTSFLLHLTNEVLNAIPGYTPDVQTLPQVLGWLSDLDRGWLAVLRCQLWDPNARVGVDVVLPADTPLRSTLVSQTERTRLRSMLIAGMDRMEEWLAQLDTAGQDFELTLEQLGLQQGFDDLFSGTLSEMGSLAGSMNDPQGMEGTC